MLSDRMIGHRLLFAFKGIDSPSPEILRAVKDLHIAGVTLFREANIQSPSQVRHLTEVLQSDAKETGDFPLIIAADQEGGQLVAVGETTPFPGNMALGATGSEELARETGRAIALEVAAVGVNVNYAPVCDVNSNPENPVIGIRSFGEDPELVGRMCAAMVEGMQSVGVAATAKHFPGHGDTSSDSHLGLPVVERTPEEIEGVDLPPFRAAVRAGVQLVMSAHVAYPTLSGGRLVPATLSPRILRNLLRKEIGFRGVVVSDAMNMHAIRQGEELWVELVSAARSGVDLLLMAHEPPVQEAAYDALAWAVQRGLLSRQRLRESYDRIVSLKKWLAGVCTPPLDVIRSKEHMEIAHRTAERSVTLVRDRAKLVPIRLRSGDRVAIVIPRPKDLTLADTSSYEHVALADAFRRRYPRVDEFVVSFSPSRGEITGIRDATSKYSLFVVGTINAFKEPRQADLVKTILSSGVPTIVVSLRLPYDIRAFPEAPTYACTYSLQEPSMEALTKALFGDIQFRGKLPVSLF